MGLSCDTHAHFFDITKKGGKSTRELPGVVVLFCFGIWEGLSSEKMELEFEHIDWNDIMEAELSGDQDALAKLRLPKLK